MSKVNMAASGLRIHGIEGKPLSQIRLEVSSGARFVCFPYCISILVLSFKRSSDIYLLTADENSFAKGLRYWLASLFLGWWGIPHGILWTIQSLFYATRGGKDVTEETLEYLENPPRPFDYYCPGCVNFAFGRGVCVKHGIPVVANPLRFFEFCAGKDFQRIPMLLPEVNCYACGAQFSITESERYGLRYCCPVCQRLYEFNSVGFTVKS